MTKSDLWGSGVHGRHADQEFQDIAQRRGVLLVQGNHFGRKFDLRAEFYATARER